MMISRFLTSLLIITFSITAKGNSGVDSLISSGFEEADRIVLSAINDSAFPGAVLLVMKEGTVLYEKAYGHFTYDNTSTPVSVNTIFDLASATKVIATTTAAMICVDRGLFELEDKAARYIPEFKKNNKGHISIKNLLLHNSGLPSWKQYYRMYNRAEDVLSDIYSSALEYQTNSKMIYSDLGIITIGKIIEKVTGKSLDDFCRDEIFVPLGMRNTFFNPSAEIKNKTAPTELDNYWRMRLLQGEVHDETASLLNGIAGHAGLFSTASDVSKVLKMLLDQGEYENTRMIKPETVNKFTRKYSALSTRALGWDTKSAAGSSAGILFSSLAFGHTGYTGTSVWADPLGKIAVVFLTNRVYPTRNNLKIIKVRPLLHDAVIKAIEN
jgi:CubicO group peptidase (beta-lactamase class C family)